MNLDFSIIIPVYNRPDELDELLASINAQTFNEQFEVLIIEDGSEITSAEVVVNYDDKLNIKYFSKENSGPGLSRNFGMQKAQGNYFIILDSDCILPKKYLAEVYEKLQSNFTDAFGGADASHHTFTVIQKAISYAMTSILTTGGIRGSKKLKSKFQPRSFNMGISKEAFEKTQGFSKQRFGEDIDLTFRLWQKGLETQFIENAFVYHKRRTNWKSFYRQTFNFGSARPILNRIHPGSARIIYWFPSFFILSFIISIVAFILRFKWFLYFFLIYFSFIFFNSLFKNKNLWVALFSIYAVSVQFFGYGSGFLRSQFKLNILGYNKRRTFPQMFS